MFSRHSLLDFVVDYSYILALISLLILHGYRLLCFVHLAYLWPSVVNPDPLDPDPYGNANPIRIQEQGNRSKLTKKLNSSHQKDLLYISFMTFHLHSVYFSFKNTTFLWRKSKSLTRIQVCMDPHWFGSLEPNPNPQWGWKPYPDPHWNQCGSTALPMTFWQSYDFYEGGTWHKTLADFTNSAILSLGICIFPNQSSDFSFFRKMFFYL